MSEQEQSNTRELAHLKGWQAALAGAPNTLFDSPGGDFDGALGSAAVIAHQPAFALESGSLAIEFSMRGPSVRQTLLSKDSSGYDGGGHLGVFLEGGDIVVRMQDAASQTELTVPAGITEGDPHRLVIDFGETGLVLYLDGVEVASDLSWTHGLQGNEEPIVLGANQWASGDGVADNLMHPFDGSIARVTLYDSPTGGVSDDVPQVIQDPVLVFSESEAAFDGTVASAVVRGHEEAFELASGTLALAFNAETLAGRQTLFSKDSSGFDSGGHIGIFLVGDGLVVRMQDEEAQTEVTLPGAVTQGQTHHLALNFGEGGLSLYLDGGEVASDRDWLHGLQGNEEPIVLGANQWASGDGAADNLSHGFAGSIFDVVLYDGQLSTTEISQLASAILDGSGAQPPDEGPGSEDPEPNADEPSVGLNNFVHQGFNGDVVPQNGIGDYASFYVGRTNNGPGSVEISEDGVLGNSLKATLQDATMQLQFNPRDENSSKGFAREYGDDAHSDWKFNSYDRMRIWIKKPVHENDGISDTGAFTGNMQIGTYIKDAIGGPTNSDETDNGHYYHYVGAPNNGEWTQVILNMHPNHQRSLSGALDHGVLENPTGEEGFNYFDTLTRFYIDDRISSDDGAPLVYHIDEIEFFESPYQENDAQIYSLASNYVAGSNELNITWNRHKDDNDVAHEVRYAFQNVHEIGWDNAFLAPDGLVSPLGFGGYNGMHYQTDDLALKGQEVVYIAIKPENAELFTQIEVALDPDGDAQVNYEDFLLAHRSGQLFEVGEPDNTVTAVAGVADNFDFDSMTSGSITTIRAFDVSEGDRIDIADLLPDLAGSQDGIEGYLQVTHSDNSTMIAIDRDGGGDAFQALAIVENLSSRSLSDLVDDQVLIL